MTQEQRDRLQYQISVMQAFAEGKEIEWFFDGRWITCDFPSWDWFSHDYRIKPEPPKPTYRPFESAEEVMQAVKEHGCWVISGGTQYRQITGIGYGCNPDVVKMNGANWMKLSELFEAIWADDKTPVGMLIEE